MVNKLFTKKATSAALPSGKEEPEEGWSVTALVFNKVDGQYVVQVIKVLDPSAIQVLESKTCGTNFGLARGTLDILAEKHGVIKL